MAWLVCILESPASNTAGIKWWEYVKKDNTLSDANVLLIDDMVDSKWTITVAASKLVREAGMAKVFAFALANSQNSED